MGVGSERHAPTTRYADPGDHHADATKCGRDVRTCRTVMKFSLALPVDAPPHGGEFHTHAITEVAAAIEVAGFDACFVTDHPFPPDAWVRDQGGHHAPEPLVTLAFAGAATTRLQLHTNVFLPQYRNPFVAAKGVATLDALSNGRVILGVAAGYLEPEFDAVGADFKRRGRALDESLDLM